MKSKPPIDAKETVLNDPVLDWMMAFTDDTREGGKLRLYRHWVRYGDGVGKALLYSNCYAKTHAYLQFLVQEARKVTPDVELDKIDHNIINNSSHKGMMTCEWPCPEKPDGYDEINNLPCTF
jgi:hypothetical protein